MTDPAIPLGRDVAYPGRYDPGLLFPIARSQGRQAIGLTDGALPFIGHDRWHAYELSWLDARGKPVVATATIEVPADSPCLIESKSLKLYLNSLNGERFGAPETVLERLRADLSAAAQTQVSIVFGLPAFGQTTDDGIIDIDGIDVDIARYGPPDPSLLMADTDAVVEQALRSNLLKSNCPVTGQPDWASVTVRCRGPRLDPAALLRYLVSFRDHAEFHEQCVERIFNDLLERARPSVLSVEARYTRRGGLDINPWRATPGLAPPEPTRDLRQ